MPGLPDFGSPLGAWAFADADDPSLSVAVPHGLALATDPDGVPRITLERFRGANPNQPPASYGLVSVHVELTWPAEVEERPPARLAVPDAGTLDFSLTTVDGDVVHSPLAWDGMLVAPWGCRVTPSTITWLIDALDQGRLPLLATAAVQVRGVAPRLPVRVRVDWELLAPMLGAAAPLVALLNELANPSGAVTVLAGTAADEALAAVLVERLGALIGADASRGVQELELRLPQVVRRTFEVTGNLAAQLADAPRDPARQVPAGVVVPALELGWSDVDVLANLPGQPVGLLACSANLTAAPNPPARHQAASAGVDLTSGRRSRATLRLAPGEALAYRVEPSMVLATSAGVVELAGPVRGSTSQRLLLNPSDFGVRAITVRAEAAVLALGDLDVAIPDAGEWVRARLTAAAPEAGFVLPADGFDTLGQPTLSLALRRADATVVLPPQPAESVVITLAQVPGWGHHRIAITTASAELVAVALTDELGGQSVVVTVTPDQPASYQWFAADPFTPGYRYRLLPLGEPGPWQGPIAPDTPLVLAPASTKADLPTGPGVPSDRSTSAEARS